MAITKLNETFGSRLDGAVIVDQKRFNISENLSGIANEQLINALESSESEGNSCLVLSLTGYLPHHSGISFGLSHKAVDEKGFAFFSPFIKPPTEDKSLIEGRESATVAYIEYIEAITKFIIKNSSRFGEIRILASSLGGIVFSDVIRNLTEIGGEENGALIKIRSVMYLNSPLAPEEVTVTLEQLNEMEMRNFDKPGWSEFYPSERIERERLLAWLIDFIYHNKFKFPGQFRLPEKVKVRYISTSLGVDALGRLFPLPDIDPIIAAVPDASNSIRLSTIIRGSDGLFFLRELFSRKIEFIPVSSREGATVNGHYANKVEISRIIEVIRKTLE